MMQIVLFLGQPIGNFYRIYNTRRIASDAIKLLESQGLIDCLMVTAGRGSKLKLIRLTPLGWELLTTVGIYRPAMLIQGGDLHDFAARALKACALAKDEVVEFERLVGSVRFDAIWRRHRGPDLYINVGVSDPQREAESLARALELPDLTRVRLVHVGVSTRFNKGVARRLKQLKPDLADGVEYRLLGSLVKSAYMKE